MPELANLNELLEMAATARWETVPADVRLAARLSLVDTMGVMRAGRDLGAAAVARRYLERYRHPPTAGACAGGGGAGAAAGTVPAAVAGPAGLEPASAAWLTGIAGHVLDYDDTHWPTILHASNPILAALLATGPTGGGRRFLEAYLAGFECASRVARSMPKGHYDRGWHITGTVGGIGAAVAVTRLLGGGAARMRSAVSLAADQASGHRQHFGSMAKSLNAGNAARSGLESALLVHEGFEPDPEGLEGRRGMWQVMSDDPDPSALNDGLGTRWEMRSNGIKPYPSGVVTHPAIEAAEEVRRQLGPAPDITGVELVVHPLVSELTDKIVSADLDVKFSVRTLVAVGLLGGARDLANYRASGIAGREDVQHLASLVQVVDDRGTAQEEAEIRVRLSDGRRLERRVVHALGSPARPLSTGQVRAKFLSLWPEPAGAVPPAEIFEALLELDRCDDVGPLLSSVVAAVAGDLPAP